MALNKIYRATWQANQVNQINDFQSGTDRTVEADAEQDLVDAEAAAGPYATFTGVVETFWIGDGA